MHVPKVDIFFQNWFLCRVNSVFIFFAFTIWVRDIQFYGLNIEVLCQLIDKSWQSLITGCIRLLHKKMVISFRLSVGSYFKLGDPVQGLVSQPEFVNYSSAMTLYSTC